MKPEILFRALSDQTRLRLLVLIYLEQELCVYEMTYALKLAQPKISRHLALLREMKLVQDTRSGLWVYYHIRRDLPQWVKQVLKSTIDGIAQSSPFTSDRTMLQNMPNRPEKQKKVVSIS